MTKAEEKLLELLLEKIEGLEEKLDETALEAAEAKKTAAAAKKAADSKEGGEVHHHYHTTYNYPRPYNPYPHYPYSYPLIGGGTWMSSSAASAGSPSANGIQGGSISINALNAATSSAKALSAGSLERSSFVS